MQAKTFLDRALLAYQTQRSDEWSANHDLLSSLIQNVAGEEPIGGYWDEGRDFRVVTWEGVRWWLDEHDALHAGLLCEVCGQYSVNDVAVKELAEIGRLEAERRQGKKRYCSALCATSKIYQRNKERGKDGNAPV